MNNLGYLLKLVIITAALSFLVITGTQSDAFAAKIRKVKKSKVYLKLSKKDKFEVGETYTIYTKKGKKRGEVKITKLRKRKAVGKVTKGKARRSYYVRAPKGSKNGFFGSILDGGKNIYAGGLFGFSMDSMSDDKSSKNSEGTGISIKGFYDHPLFSFMWLRASAGMQQFKSDCAEVNCAVSVNYLTFDGYGRFVFNKKSKFKMWAGPFVSGMFPLGADGSTYISSDGILTTSTYGVAGGLDYKLNKKYMIPIMIEYGMFPSGKSENDTTISASSINIRAGIGMRW